MGLCLPRADLRRNHLRPHECQPVACRGHGTAPAATADTDAYPDADPHTEADGRSHAEADRHPEVDAQAHSQADRESRGGS